jgi:EAL domain-containing protein (putative c-di-GMP-specific phosphodiesterase class I)
MEWRLRSAIDNHELELYLQPQHRKDSSVCGAEMLLRWRHDGKLIPPDEFIPVAEDCGLIYSLGDWVVEEACRIAGTLAPLVASRDFSLALNVSPRQFQHKDFIATVIDSLTRHEIPRGLVELEITEGLLIDDSDSIPEKMQILRGHGLRFSIDDFGTGYSSLRYLKKLPLDALKIDSSFVRDVLDDDAHASIVRTIISIARAFELDVIAEGVESAAVHEFLADAGCPRFQGYHYSRPMPLAEFCRLLTVAPTEEDDAGVIAHIG